MADRRTEIGAEQRVPGRDPVRVQRAGRGRPASPRARGRMSPAEPPKPLPGEPHAPSRGELARRQAPWGGRRRDRHGPGMRSPHRSRPVASPAPRPGGAMRLAGRPCHASALRTTRTPSRLPDEIQPSGRLVRRQAPRPGPGHSRRPCPTPTRPDEPRAVGGWRSVTVRATGCHHAPVTLSRSPPHRPTPATPLTPRPMARTDPHTLKTPPLNATWPNPAPALRNPTPPTPPSSFGRARKQPTPPLSVRRSGRVAVTRDVVLLRFRLRPLDPLRRPPRR